jgi:act minimal PKS acyl carrier protein
VNAPVEEGEGQIVSQLTFEDLKQILVQCAGEVDTVSLGDDVLDVPFTDLGYDSLALLETAAVIEQRFGMPLTDEDVSGAQTPRQFLDVVNDPMSRAS